MQLEDDLLERLANAPDDILSDVPLIEGLEATKVHNVIGTALIYHPLGDFSNDRCGTKSDDLTI